MEARWAARKSMPIKPEKQTRLSRIGEIHCKRSLQKYPSSRKLTPDFWNSESIVVFLNTSLTLTHGRLPFREMWREEAKLQQQRNNAQEQLRTAERNLASTMDKVRSTSEHPQALTESK
jgi:hypothetical protein